MATPAEIAKYIGGLVWTASARTQCILIIILFIFAFFLHKFIMNMLSLIFIPIGIVYSLSAFLSFGVSILTCLKIFDVFIRTAGWAGADHAINGTSAAWRFVKTSLAWLTKKIIERFNDSPAKRLAARQILIKNAIAELEREKWSLQLEARSVKAQLETDMLMYPPVTGISGSNGRSRRRGRGREDHAVSPTFSARQRRLVKCAQGIDARIAIYDQMLSHLHSLYTSLVSTTTNQLITTSMSAVTHDMKKLNNRTPLPHIQAVVHGFQTETASRGLLIDTVDAALGNTREGEEISEVDTDRVLEEMWKRQQGARM